MCTIKQRTDTKFLRVISWKRNQIAALTLSYWIVSLRKRHFFLISIIGGWKQHPIHTRTKPKENEQHNRIVEQKTKQISADKNIPNKHMVDGHHIKANQPHRLRESAAARRSSSTEASGDAGRMPRSTRHRTLRRFANRRLSSSAMRPPSAAGEFDSLKSTAPQGSPRTSVSTRPDAINSCVYLYRPRKGGSFLE